MIGKVSDGWKVEKLGNLCQITTGKKDANFAEEEGIYPFYTCSAKPIKSNTYSFSGKAILLAGNGNLENMFLYDGKFEAYQRTYILQNLDNSLSYEYLFFNLKKHWVKYNDSKQYGSIINYIKMNNITNYSIVIPPLQQQEKIVKVLDISSALIEKQKELLNKYDLFLKSKFIEMFGDPVSNPMGWEVTKLNKILKNIDSGWSPVCKNHSRTSNNYGILKLSSLSNDRYNFLENKEMIDELEPKINNLVSDEDLLFSRKNTYMLVGSCSYVFKTEDNLFIPDLIFRLNTNNSVNKIFLWKYLANDLVKVQLRNIANGAAASMPNISKTKLLDFKIVLPPIDLQNKFASIVEKTEQIKEQEAKKLEHLEVLHNSLMDKAFKGEIV